MKDVFVIADNVVSPLGFTTTENFTQLKNDVTAIQHHANSIFSPTPFWAAITDREKIDDAFEGDALTYTHFEKLCILSISEALKKTDVSIRDAKTLLIISTTKGNIDLLLENKFDKKRVYLHESGKVIQHYFQNPNIPLVVSNACISGVVALNTAAQLLQQKKYENIIVCGADIVCEFTISGFEAFKALSPSPCKPFDSERDGTSLGEGAATLILSNVYKSGIKILAGASSNDANHISGPSRTGDGLFIAVDKTLKGHHTPKIDFISAHGTGTIFNDEMEAKAFTLATLQDVPTNSLKGFFGHTFGAAGIIESAITLESMRQNLLIPSKGFQSKSENINLNIISSLQRKEIKTALKTASGFGGCNAAVLFQKN